MTQIEPDDRPPDDERLDEEGNCEQRAAVEAEEQAIAVLAGPGSGKTRTLAHRARHLLEHDPGSRALLLTFTNKAASEMKTRALRTGTIEPEQIEAGTFHHFGHMLLRSIHGKLVGIEPDFDILDEQESKDSQPRSPRHISCPTSERSGETTGAVASIPVLPSASSAWSTRPPSARPTSWTSMI